MICLVAAPGQSTHYIYLKSDLLALVRQAKSTISSGKYPAHERAVWQTAVRIADDYINDKDIAVSPGAGSFVLLLLCVISLATVLRRSLGR